MASYWAPTSYKQQQQQQQQQQQLSESVLLADIEEFLQSQPIYLEPIFTQSQPAHFEDVTTTTTTAAKKRKREASSGSKTMQKSQKN